MVDNARLNETIKATVKEYEIKITHLSKDADDLYKMFTKEIKLKDNILD